MRRFKRVFALIVCSVSALWPQMALAQSFEEQVANAPPIHKIEEDWEILIANPDPGADLPQIATVFGPTNALFDTHAVFELNHGTLPSFGEGGMQLQVWHGNWLMGYLYRQNPTELNISNEVIRFTTKTALGEYNGHRILTLQVQNGTSTTYGAFGADNSLRVRLYTHRNDLNPYEPNNSLENSRVTYGANHVSYFKRTDIRFYDEHGDLYVSDTTDRYIHQLATPPDDTEE